MENAVFAGYVFKTFDRRLTTEKKNFHMSFRLLDLTRNHRSAKKRYCMMYYSSGVAPVYIYGMHVYHVYTIRLMSAYTARNILLIWPTRAHKHRGQTQVEPCRNIVWNACFDCAPFGSLFELHCNVQRLLTLMREVYSRFLQLFTLGIMECGSQHKVVVM